MPGIAGFVSRYNIEGKQNQETAKTMVRSMLHEKHYRSGIYGCSDLGVQIGWVCHENSFSDCLPIWNETKDVCLLLIGESFLDSWVLDELRIKGHDVHSHNASCIVHLYEERGGKFLEELNGSFSGVLVDFREMKCILFNDRFGLGRIYYHQSTEGLYFASEAKALLKVMPRLRQLDLFGLGEVVSCGAALDNRTLFSSVFLVPPASKWTWHADRLITKETYFQPSLWENQSPLSHFDYYQQLSNTFARILPKYFTGHHQRLAVSLTGGLDGRMMMAWAPCLPFKTSCYTFQGLYRDSFDTNIAKKVAEICQQHHATIAINRKFFADFPALAKRAVYYSDGTMDVSGAVDLYMNRMAREIAPVRVAGSYGDQIVGGVLGRRPTVLSRDLFSDEFMRYIDLASDNYDQVVTGNQLSLFVSKQLPWYHYPRFALENTQVILRLPFLDNELIALAFRSPISMINQKASFRLIADGNLPLSKIPTDRGISYHPIPVIGWMRHLYYECIIKAENMLDSDVPKSLWLLNSPLVLRYLQRFLLGRQKLSHFTIWYRSELSKYVKDVLLDSRTRARPYLNEGFLEKMVSSHVAGKDNFTKEINCLLTMELIQRHLIEQK